MENHAKITNRYNFVPFLLLTLITCGIYAIYTFGKIGDQLNLIAGRYDGQRTMNFWLLTLVISPITCGIAQLVWWHKTSERLSKELLRRQIPTNFSAGTYWLWCVLGTLILIGPFVYFYKLFQNMNQLIDQYNSEE